MANGSARLRILFIARQYPPNMAWGGIGAYVATIGVALAARGHEVHVLSCVEGQANRDYVDKGVFVHDRGGSIPAEGLWNMSKKIVKGMLKIPKTLWRIEKGLGAYCEYRRLGLSVDVIEYPDWGGLGTVFAALKGRPLVATLHTPPPSAYRIPMSRDMRWAWSLVYQSCRRADVTTLTSEFHLNALKADHWDPGENIRFIPLLIDCEEWKSSGPVSCTDPIVLFAGRLERVKAPEVLVDAIALVRRKIPGATAVFAGNSGEEREGLPYLDWLKATAGDLSGCVFAGAVPRKEMRTYLSRSRVLAIPSVFDVYPVASLEAMAAGRPVVATRTTGTSALIERYGCGTAVPPSDPVALAEALLPYLSDPRYAAEAGERAQSAVRENNDVDVIAAERETVYLEAIRRFNRMPEDI